VHLASALGKPVWLLNRFDTCWRWLQNRNDTPWYPSLRSFANLSPGLAERDQPQRGALQHLVDGDHSQLRPPMLTG
jgi:hypothetical protein